MTTSNSGAVFFLGTRAHYQVLQQPESRFDFDTDNGNASTESIYQNPSVDSAGNYIGEGNMAYCDNEVNEDKEREVNSIKKRSKRRQSETALCEKDIDMKPAMLNNINESETPKSKPSKRRLNILTFLSSLYKRKKKLDTNQLQYLESVLQTCSYRECCRCLDCQSRYFDVDESDYSSDESDYDYSSYYVAPQPSQMETAEEDDDEVFLDPSQNDVVDSTSTELLVAPASTHVPREIRLSDWSEGEPEPGLDIEVAAGTPLLLNYLLTHPITCAIQ